MLPSEIYRFFIDRKEFYGAGYYEEPHKSPFERFSRALRRYFENYSLPEYRGEPLYPCGNKYHTELVNPDFSYTIDINWACLSEQSQEVKEILENDFNLHTSRITSVHTVGGNMYTHSHPNFERIAADGLDSYEERICKISDGTVREGLLDVMAGIRNYHGRILRMLEEKDCDPDLYKALTKVPFSPCETLYEAVVCRNFVFYLDGCDNIGRLDADLIKYYRGEDITSLLRSFYQNIDASNGWSGALGPNYNPITLQCLRASHGMRRPSLELRITEDMPDEIWDAALESIQAGGGSPSLYNEKGYQSALERLFPDIPQSDRLRFAGGGCTETMLAGISNVGSLDAGINVALIFERFMREELINKVSFEDFYSSFIERYRNEAFLVLDGISKSQKLREEYCPHPMRTLLTDDCIDKGKDFNGGGARFYSSVVNLAGIINVLDSLLVIRHLVYGEGGIGANELLKLMDSGETFLGYRGIPRHGTDSDEATEMAYRLSTDLTKPMSEVKPYLGGIFIPSSIQFVTYADAGKNVGATPDGRKAGDPLCDSIGAVHGNDKNGLTALLNSASSLNQQSMSGTPVLNIRLDPTRMHKSLKALALGYFENGGLQIQVTCVNRDELLRAKENPEGYPNLVVRIGGYSEYFCRLSPELRQTVIDRTEFGG